MTAVAWRKGFSAGGSRSQTGPGTYGVGTELTWSARGSRLATRTTHLTLGSASTSRTVGWSYDTHGRLSREQVSVNGTPTRDTAVTISPAGDVTVLGGRTLAYTGGLLASVSEGGETTAYSHDGAGRRTVAASDEATCAYSWDASGRLTGVRIDREGSNDTTATYGYAADGSRARSVTTEGTRTTEVTYRYEGLSLMSLSATDDAGVWGIDLVYEGDRATSGLYRHGGTVTRFLVTTSERGDVIALTDAAGESFANYAYTAYGEIETFETTGTALLDAETARDIATRQPLRYAGYVWDAVTGLYQCSARYLDPHTCSFISPDPIRADGEMSAYRYCGGDPVNAADPSGLFTISVFAVGIIGRARDSSGDKDASIVAWFGVHAWFRITNTGSKRISFMGVWTKPGDSLYVGTWGPDRVSRGAYYNREPTLGVNAYGYGGRVSLSESIADSKLSTLQTWVKSHRGWSKYHNCSYFAAGAWNSVAKTPVSALSEGFYSPEHLAQSILSSSASHKHNLGWGSWRNDLVDVRL